MSEESRIALRKKIMEGFKEASLQKFQKNLEEKMDLKAMNLVSVAEIIPETRMISWALASFSLVKEDLQALKIKVEHKAKTKTEKRIQKLLINN